MFGRIRSENQCVQKKGKYLSIWKDKIRIPIFIKKGQYSYVWKDKIRFPVFIGNRAKISMFGRIRSENQCV